MLDSEQIDLNSVCRVCLLNAQDMKFLEDFYSKTKLILADVYKTVTNIEFTDMLPKQICHDCFCELNQSYKYILKCRNSNRQIQTNLDKISKLIIDTQIKSVQTSKESVTFRKDYVKSVVNNLIGKTTPNETQIVRSPSIKSLKYPLTFSELLIELEQDLYVTETDKIKTNAMTIFPKSIAIIDPIDSNPKQKCDAIQTTKTPKLTIKTKQKRCSTSKALNKNINSVSTKPKVASKTLNGAQIFTPKSIFEKRIKHMKCHDEIYKKQKSSKLSGTKSAMNKNTDLREIRDENLIIINNNSTNTASMSKIPEENSKLRKRKLKSTKTNSNISKNNLDELSKNLNEVITINKIKKSPDTTKDETIEEKQKTPRLDNRRLTRQMKTINNGNPFCSPKPYSCINCAASFYKEVNLHKHQIIHALDKPYACSICGNKYQNKSGLTKHERTHSGIKPYKCQICPKAFTQKVHMRQHMLSHTNEQPYSCSHCDTKFKRKTNMLRHAIKHTGVRLFSCSVCNKGFIKKQFLMTHLLSHNGGKLFSCKNCEKSFSQQIHLTYHERTHTGEQPHPCIVCNKSFSQIANLNRHLRTHTEVKVYTCAVCDWSFKEKSNLAKHVSMHVGEKLLICEICSSPFNSKVNLTRHLSTHEYDEYTSGA